MAEALGAARFPTVVRSGNSLRAARQAMSLGQLLQRLGPSLLHVLTAPVGLDHAVEEPIILDAEGDASVSPGSVAFVVGVSPHTDAAERIVSALARQGAVAACFRQAKGNAEALARLGEAHGISILEVPRSLSWDRLYSVMQTVLTTTRRAGERGPMGTRMGDLFALAQALAAVLRCPVTIDDELYRTLAYSSDEGIDTLRRESVLARRIPPQWLGRLESEGVIKRLRSSDQIVRFPAWKDLDPPAEHPRAGIGVRAGRNVVGFIFVAEREPLGPEGEAALHDAAQIAAIHILRNQVSDEVEETGKADLARTLLEGRTAVAGALGLPKDCLLSVFAIDQADAHPSMAPGVIGRIILPLVQLQTGGQHRHAYCAELDGLLYVVVGHPASSHPVSVATVTHFATSVITQAKQWHNLDVRVGISSRTPISDAARARDQARRALRTLDLTTGMRIAHIEEVQNESIVQELTAYMAANPHLLEGPVDRLRALPRDKATRWSDALAAYLRCNRNVPAAAKLLAIPSNTLRYRVRAALDRAALNLDDPAARLVAELQLRALRSRDRQFVAADGIQDPNLTQQT